MAYYESPGVMNKAKTVYVKEESKRKGGNETL